MTEKNDFSPRERAPEALLSRPVKAAVGADTPSSEEQQMSWPALERQMILNALIQSKGKRIKAAEILGWGRSTLWRKMEQYRIDI